MYGNRELGKMGGMQIGKIYLLHSKQCNSIKYNMLLNAIVFDWIQVFKYIASRVEIDNEHMMFLYIPPAPLRYPIILEEDDTPDKVSTPIIMSYINCKSKLFNYPCLSITRGFYFFFHYKIHIKVINIANMFNRFVFRVAQVSNASSRKSTSS